MREHPILFSTEMVRAILDGRKTMTRRTKGLEYVNTYTGTFVGDGDPFGELGYKGLLPNDYWLTKQLHRDFEVNSGCYHWFLGKQDRELNPIPVKCPYGKVGDRLWVRESWCDIYGTIVYKADDIREHPEYYGIKWKSGRFMFKKYARIWLEITNIRVERLQDITEADAKAEGFLNEYCTSLALFQRYWDIINGIGSWAVNPWVWVIEFKRLESVK